MSEIGSPLSSLCGSEIPLRSTGSVGSMPKLIVSGILNESPPDENSVNAICSNLDIGWSSRKFAGKSPVTSMPANVTAMPTTYTSANAASTPRRFFASAIQSEYVVWKKAST